MAEYWDPNYNLETSRKGQAQPGKRVEIMVGGAHYVGWADTKVFPYMLKY
jgi:hypothetical protein